MGKNERDRGKGNYYQNILNEKKFIFKKGKTRLTFDTNC